MRLIDADAIPYTMLYKENWLKGTGVEKPGVWKDTIDAMPTIEPERKKGKWMPENRTIDAFWVCSSCGFPSEAHAANILYNFCPNCGADMRGDSNE